MSQDSETTAEEILKSSRCPLPPNIENDLRIIARGEGLTHCDVVAGIEFKKLEAECAELNQRGVTHDRCKYVTIK